MRITLRQLLYFDALARERHFSRAAARVSVSQPAMSAQIGALEEILGGSLVDRSGGQLALTPLGRQVWDAARTMLDTGAEIEAMGTAGDPPLRLGLIPTVAPYLVPAYLDLVGAGAAVTISEALTADLLDGLRRGDLDAAVVALPAGGAEFCEIPLFDDPMLLAMPPETVRPDWRPADRPDGIEPSRLLLLQEGHCLADQALAACSLRREHLSLSLGATSLTTVSRLVAAGQGITLLPRLAVAVEGHGLRLIHFDAPEPRRRIGLVARTGARSAPWLADLADGLTRAHTTLDPA